MVTTTKIEEGYDLRKILEVLLDDLSHSRLIDDTEVRRIIEAGKPDQAS
jgi:hypothetical protein